MSCLWCWNFIRLDLIDSCNSTQKMLGVVEFSTFSGSVCCPFSVSCLCRRPRHRGGRLWRWLVCGPWEHPTDLQSQRKPTSTPLHMDQVCECVRSLLVFLCAQICSHCRLNVEPVFVYNCVRLPFISCNCVWISKTGRENARGGGDSEQHVAVSETPPTEWLWSLQVWGCQCHQPTQQGPADTHTRWEGNTAEYVHSLLLHTFSLFLFGRTWSVQRSDDTMEMSLDLSLWITLWITLSLCLYGSHH